MATMPDAQQFTPQLTELTDGLRFPEGPIAMSDGSIVLVEMFGPRLTRVAPDGTHSTIAEIEGGPNGAAVGPDGAFYLCNNGGCFAPAEFGGMMFPGAFVPERYIGGRIQRVDPHDGSVTDLYTECDGRPLRAPNDLVMDGHGGFWFTDHGKRRARDEDRGGLYYARPDGSAVTKPVPGLLGANGVGLSPDGGTVYVAESYTGRLLAWDLDGPGQIAGGGGPGHGGRCVVATPAGFDSLAVEADGHVVVAAITHGLCVVDPLSGDHEFLEMPDPLVTNICFTGDDHRTAYITMSGVGWLGEATWPRPGLPLNF